MGKIISLQFRLLPLLFLLSCSYASADWSAEPFVDLGFSAPAVAGNWLYFFSSLQGHLEVWRTDGTVGATQRVLSLDTNPSVTGFVNMDGNLYFLTYYDGSTRLWKAVPETGEVTLLETLPVGGVYRPLAAEGALYFELAERVYKTNGTVGSAISFPRASGGWGRFVCALGNRAVYLLNNAYNSAVYCTDGTSEGTVLLGTYNEILFSGDMPWNAMKQDTPPENTAGQVPLKVTHNGVLYFAGTESMSLTKGLWKTDGTLPGTLLVKETQLIGAILDVDGGAYFSCDCTGSSRCLFFTDGTEEGTQALHRLYYADIGIFAVLGGDAYFFDGDTSYSELWKTDGTVEGTVLLQSFGTYQLILPFCALADRMLVCQLTLGGLTATLWQSNGTPAGTSLLNTMGEFGGLDYPVEAANAFFFDFKRGSVGSELWVSDWTPEGTHIVPGVPATSNIQGMVVLNNKLYLTTQGSGQIWVCSNVPDEESQTCDPGHVLVSELANLAGLTAIYWPEVETALADLGLDGHLQYDLENAHLILGGVSPAPPVGPEPGDGFYDWFQLRLVEYVLCNDRFWAHDAVTELFNQNKLLFEQDIAALYAASCTPEDPDGDHRLVTCGENLGKLVPAACLISTNMRETIDGILAIGFGDAAAPFTLLPQINSYATCCGDTKAAGNLFSPDGDLDQDGKSNLDEFNTVMATTGNYESALIAVWDENDLWPGNPEMPAAGFAALAMLAAGLAACAAHRLNSANRIPQ